MHDFRFFQPQGPLAGLVECIWTADVSAETARTLIVNVLPTTSPILCLHLGAQTVSETGSGFSSRQRMTGVTTRALALRPSGPMKSVMVRLRPEAAARFIGGGLSNLTDVAVPLGDIFDPNQFALLEERLSETPDAGSRVAEIQSFLVQRLRGKPDRLVDQAAAWLRREPNLTIGHLASRLDISDRQLERRFRAAMGTSPKEFSRVARIEKVVRRARRHSPCWTDIAYACGFSDQAHLINEFKVMVGLPPAAFFRSTDTLAVSSFANTFIARAPD